jgi:hypothetical protein
MCSLIALLLYLWICHIPTPTSTHHVFFEEIGEMAGALSYIHAILPVNISCLYQAVQNFCHHINIAQQLFQTQHVNLYKEYKDKVNAPELSIAQQNCLYAIEVVEIIKEDTADL